MAFSLARGRAHDVDHDGQWQQSIECERDHGAEYAARGAGGLGHCHHQSDIQPGDNNEIHGRTKKTSEARVFVEVCAGQGGARLGHNQNGCPASPRLLHGIHEQGCSMNFDRSEEHTSELQSPCNLVCRLLLEKKKKIASMSISFTKITMLTNTTRIVTR